MRQAMVAAQGGSDGPPGGAVVNDWNDDSEIRRAIYTLVTTQVLRFDDNQMIVDSRHFPGSIPTSPPPPNAAVPRGQTYAHQTFAGRYCQPLGHGELRDHDVADCIEIVNALGTLRAYGYTFQRDGQSKENQNA